MPRSYLYEMTSFPAFEIGESRQLPCQLTLTDEYQSPVSSIKLNRRLNGLPVDVFKIDYEIVEYRAGRYNEIQFSEFIAKYYFSAYYYLPKMLFMMLGRRDVARGAAKAIIDSLPGFKGSNKKIDLESIRPMIPSFKGVWFELTGEDVKSQGLFGYSVEQNPLFQNALDEGGRIKNIRFNYSFDNYSFHVGVSEDYGIVVYDQLEEHLELRLVVDIKEKLLDKARPKD